MTVSVAIPSLSGGGAEKVTLLLVRELIRSGSLSKIYVGSPCKVSDSLECGIVNIGGSRASHGLFNFIKACLRDPADTFMLTLGFVNFAPFLRVCRPKARIVLRIGNTPSPEINELKGLARLRYVSSMWMATWTATEVVAQCEYMARDLGAGFNVPESKMRIIYNPIEPGLASWPPGRTVPAQVPYIFSAATFKPQKDLETLVAAFALSRNKYKRRLVIGGVAPGDRRFSRLLEVYGVDKRQVVCFEFRDNIYDLIRDADICVLASRYEGFSNFLLESAALGKFIIASDCPGGNAELFKYYNNYRTFPVGDRDLLAQFLDLPRVDLQRDEVYNGLARFGFQYFIERYEAVLGLGRD